MAIKRLPLYELAEIMKAAEIDAYGFGGLKTDPKGVDVVRHFRDGVEKILQEFDARWIALCEDDITELTDWANRMRFVRQNLDELDRQLAVAGRRTFSWDAVCKAMGYVNAFRVAIEQILDFNERAIVA